LRSQRSGLKVVCLDQKSFNLTRSKWVNDKYKSFYEKNGYLPEFFDVYNGTEVKDVALITVTEEGTLDYEAVFDKERNVAVCGNNTAVGMKPAGHKLAADDFICFDAESRLDINGELLLFDSGVHILLEYFFFLRSNLQLLGVEDVGRVGSLCGFGVGFCSKLGHLFGGESHQFSFSGENTGLHIKLRISGNNLSGKAE